MLVSQYKIEIKDEPQFVNETLEERKTRVLKSKAGLTVTCVLVPADKRTVVDAFESPIRVPLKFTKRS
jgi:hypothetical protein